MSNIIVLDTETAPLFPTAHPIASASLVYDLGYVIANTRNNQIVAQRNYLLMDTFDNDNYMTSAYYANKMPIYMDMLRREEIEPTDTRKAWALFLQDIKKYNVREVWAYNARFDIAALDSSLAYYTCGHHGQWIPAKIRTRDIWDYAGSTLCNTQRFVIWAMLRGLITDSGNPSTSAETVYRYITHDMEFIEDHTALSDALIELHILQTSKKRHGKARHSMGQGWRDAAAILKHLLE